MREKLPIFDKVKSGRNSGLVAFVFIVLVQVAAQYGYQNEAIAIIEAGTSGNVEDVVIELFTLLAPAIPVLVAGIFAYRKEEKLVTDLQDEVKLLRSEKS